MPLNITFSRRLRVTSGCQGNRRYNCLGPSFHALPACGMIRDCQWFRFYRSVARLKPGNLLCRFSCCMLRMCLKPCMAVVAGRKVQIGRSAESHAAWMSGCLQFTAPLGMESGIFYVCLTSAHHFFLQCHSPFLEHLFLPWSGSLQCHLSLAVDESSWLIATMITLESRL